MRLAAFCGIMEVGGFDMCIDKYLESLSMAGVSAMTVPTHTHHRMLSRLSHAITRISDVGVRHRLLNQKSNEPSTEPRASLVHEII